MRDLLVRLLGWRAMFLHGDPLVWDRYLWIRRHLGRVVGADRAPLTLDAGCGNGGFAVYAATLGHQVLGISDTERELADARRRAALLGVDNVRFETHDLRRLDEMAPGELYDNVICLEVIEHVIDDVGVLRAIGRRMPIGGRLLLSTPTAEHRPQFLEMRHQTPVEDGRHVRYGYTPADLRRVVEEAGFGVTQLEGIGGIVMQTVTDIERRLAQRNGALGWAVAAPLRVLRIIDPVVTRLTGAASLSYGVVATKLRGDEAMA